MKVKRENKKTKLFKSLVPVLLLLAGIIVIMSSCVRRGLEECSDEEMARFTVGFDYSYTGLENSGTTIVFYPTDNNPDRETVSLSTHNNSVEVNLLPGEYSVLVLNQTFSDFDHIRFRNTQTYNMAEAYVNPVSNPDELYSTPIYNSPDVLVIDTFSSFRVTPQMVKDTQSGIIGLSTDELPTTKVFTLRRRVADVNVAIHIKGMRYIKQVSCSVSGFSEGQFLANRRNNPTGIAHGLENIKPVYSDNARTVGTLTGTFNTFGLHPSPDAPYRLVFDAVLVDGKTTMHEEFDIDDEMQIHEDEYGLSITIELGTDESPAITIPVIKPEGDTPPFDPEVEDWGDEEIIEVPIR